MKIQPQTKASGNKWLHLRAAKTVGQFGEKFSHGFLKVWALLKCACLKRQRMQLENKYIHNPYSYCPFTTPTALGVPKKLNESLKCHSVEALATQTQYPPKRKKFFDQISRSPRGLAYFPATSFFSLLTLAPRFFKICQCLKKLRGKYKHIPQHKSCVLQYKHIG